MKDLRPRFWRGSGRFSQSGTGPKRGCSGFPQSHRARSRVEFLRNSNFSRTQSARKWNEWRALASNALPWVSGPKRFAIECQWGRKAWKSVVVIDCWGVSSWERPCWYAGKLKFEIHDIIPLPVGWCWNHHFSERALCSATCPELSSKEIFELREVWLHFTAKRGGILWRRLLQV